MPLGPKKEKKSHEQEVLGAALLSARRRGGECRRLSDRICGTIVNRDFDECPDIVMRHESHGGIGSIIGVEHFRVYQLNEWNAKIKKPMSTMMRVNSRLNRLKNSVRESGPIELSADQDDELGSIIEELLVAQRMSSLDSFLEAFSNTFNSHLSKSSTYRENVSRYVGAGENLKLAFLIETHVDYSHFRHWNGYKMCRLSDGELPLFKELVELFQEASDKVDYLILAMCPQFSNEVIDARIVNCSSLRSSLSRQKAKVVEYLGYTQALEGVEFRDKTKTSPHAEVIETSNDVTIRPAVTKWNCVSNLEVFRRDMDGFTRALEMMRGHIPFLATFGVAMFLELFADYAMQDFVPGIRFDLPDLIRWKEQMGPEEWEKRDKSFRKSRGIKDELLSGQYQ